MSGPIVIPERLGIVRPDVVPIECVLRGDEKRAVLMDEWTGNELVVGPASSIRALMDAGWIVCA